MILTDSQKEIAARHLCKIRGIDPDSLIGHSPPPSKGYIPAVLINSPAWHFTLTEVESICQVMNAIDFASGFKP